MDLSKAATEDNIEATTEDHIFQWAKQYLPAVSALAFTRWLNADFGDWANDGSTIRQVLTGAYQEWTGCSYPNP